MSKTNRLRYIYEKLIIQYNTQAQQTRHGSLASHVHLQGKTKRRKTGLKDKSTTHFQGVRRGDEETGDVGVIIGFRGDREAPYPDLEMSTSEDSALSIWPSSCYQPTKVVVVG